MAVKLRLGNGHQLIRKTYFLHIPKLS